MNLEWTQMAGQVITHFPANPNPMPDYKNSSYNSGSGQMIEKRRVSIVNNNGSTQQYMNGKHHSVSSNINIITSPDRHILPGVYK